MPDGDPAGTPATTDPGNGDGGKTFTQEDLDRIVGERLAREREKFGDYDDLKSKATRFDEFEASQKTELERVTTERDTLKTQADSTAQENLRLRVATAKQLPGEMIDRLRGTTKEELEADADALLKLIPPASSGFDGGPRGRPDQPTSMDDAIRRAAGRG